MGQEQGQQRSGDLPPSEALARARRAMERGQFDNHDPLGAQANALEAIAWSLIGLLEDKVHGEPSKDVDGIREASGGESLSSELRRRGFLQIDPQPR